MCSAPAGEVNCTRFPFSLTHQTRSPEPKLCVQVVLCGSGARAPAPAFDSSGDWAIATPALRATAMAPIKLHTRLIERLLRQRDVFNSRGKSLGGNWD